MYDFLKRNCYLFIGLACLITTSVHALQYGILAKNENRKEIDRFFVIGERCTGTNYLYSLIINNTELIEKPLGHKHFPPWYELEQSYYRGHPSYYTFENTENYLFLIIFRNPYDWARSFHLQPHHSDSPLANIPFSQFIRMEWIMNLDNSIYIEYFKNPFLDADPETGLLFHNIFALRSAKIKNMLEIYHRAPNVYYINYETLRDFPEQVINEIAELYHLQLKVPFSPVTTYKGMKQQKEYKPKEYIPISEEDLEYINSELDEGLENQIGYQLAKK